MIALVDGDLIAYINAAASEGETEEIALLRADKHLQGILDYIQCSQYKVFLSGGSNFRKEINPEYKANRTQPDPQHRKAIHSFLIREWNAIETDGYEADDALGCEQKEDTIICSLDKDLLMIPGKHYSWPIVRMGKVVRDHSIVEVSELEGIKTFYKQMLIGDTADNIIGINGIGKVKAGKIIDPLNTEKEMHDIVFELYSNIDDTYNSLFTMNADCLWIWRSLGVTFSVRNPFD